METKTLFKIAIFSMVLTTCKNEEVTQTEPDNYDVVSIEHDWFNVGYVEPKTYVIEEPESSQGNVSYLLLGNNRAIMFDTGSGENLPVDGYKIKPVMEELTQLPTSLLLSHFHFDHNQNISEFNTIAFPDLPFLRQAVSIDDTYSFTSEDLFIGDYPSQAQVNEWLPVNTDIDLGNRIIQLVSIPGHTDESVAIVDKTNKMAFLGDYLYNGSLFLFDNDDLEPYKESVEYLISSLTPDYKLFGAHGTPQIAYSKLEKLNNFLICIENDVCLPTATTVLGYDVVYYEYEGMEIVVFQ